MFLALIIISAILAGLTMLLVSLYNRLIVLRNRSKNAFAQIEVQLKRRHDLIPNLVEVAKGYLKHERETLTEITDLRNTAVRNLQQAGENPEDAEVMGRLNTSESQLQGALSRFNLVVEAYPELKASTSMMALSEEISSTENKVAFARQGYNDAVTMYNTTRESFPASVVSDMFHFKPAQLLEFEDHEQIQAPPKVSF
ncbi:LemA family protein [Desulforhopalus vacuolatus]|uniref:LemA family protein n=1 Tax=Desulforhopalus vacuolatus TaxID=40414 RepID=UPI001962AED3|nr:LemA family protein [Desulforhopalus vacuolatus]MBM9518308.1 LemA family protein [Desulforhopalus vacuolatus]